MFDANNAETTRIKGLVGKRDSDKLDAHLAAMRDVEKRLVGMTGTGTRSGGLACTKPDAPADVDLKNDDLYLRAGQAQMDLAVAALACDQTRILTFQWSYSESEHLFGFLNISGNHHVISHDFSSSGANYDAYNKIQIWYQSAVRVPAGQDGRDQGRHGTMLDHSIVLWATEIGESTQHDLLQMPYVLAGGADGKIRAGPPARLQQQQRDNNQMLVSIGQAMGDTADVVRRRLGRHRAASGPRLAHGSRARPDPSVRGPHFGHSVALAQVHFCSLLQTQ